MRYKLRREKQGAFVFDRAERCVFFLSEDDVRKLMNVFKGSSCEDELPESLKKRRFFLNGYTDFYMIRRYYTGATTQDYCLSAPNRLYLELTRSCGLRCRLCYNAAGRPFKDELSTAQFCSLLDQMDEIGVFEARLTGGEPTDRPDFLEILDYAISKDFYVSLATHGVWERQLLEQVCQRNIDDVIVSLEGPKEINDHFRIGGSYDTTVATIAALKSAGIKKVRINTVISKVNWDKVEALFELCEKFDLLLVDFIHPRPFGRGAISSSESLMLDARQTYQFCVLVEKLRQKYPMVKVVMDFDLLTDKEAPKHPIVPRVKACPAGREFAFVSPQGLVFPCGVAPVSNPEKLSEEEKNLFIAGSVLEKSILEIWHKSPVWKPYRDLALCKPQKCHSCRFWGNKCFGTCPIGAYFHSGNLNGEDPYCYSHLL